MKEWTKFMTIHHHNIVRVEEGRWKVSRDIVLEEAAAAVDTTHITIIIILAKLMKKIPRHIHIHQHNNRKDHHRIHRSVNVKVVQ